MTTIAPGTYHLDPTHSRIGFAVRHAMVTKVRGAFTGVEGTGTIAEGASSLHVSIDAASIDTRNADRDAHLVSGDFLDAATFPQIVFTSTSVTAVDGGLAITGDLSIRGVSREVSFTLEYVGTASDPFGNTRIGLEGAVVINRKDWGLTWNAALETGGVLVADKVTLEFEVSAIHAS